MKWIILIASMTAYNVGYDWLTGQLGQGTVAWEGGVIATALYAYLFCRDNAEICHADPTSGVTTKKTANGSALASSKG